MSQGLSPRAFAEAIGVSESSVKRWVDQGHLTAVKTAGGHRRILRTEALRYIRAHRIPIVRPDRLELPPGFGGLVGAAEPPDVVLFDLLAGGRSHEAVAYVLGLYLEGRSVASLCDDVLHPAMARLGELWLHDEAGVVLEHRATAIAVAALTELRAVLPDGPGRLVAVGGAPAGDPYLLGSLAAATVLASEGYVAMNLGPDTPGRVLRRAATMFDAQLVWLSVSADGAAQRQDLDLDPLAADLAARCGVLALGGRAVATLPPLERSNIFVGRTMGELAAFARGVARR